MLLLSWFMDPAGLATVDTGAIDTSEDCSPRCNLVNPARGTSSKMSTINSVIRRLSLACGKFLARRC